MVGRAGLSRGAALRLAARAWRGQRTDALRVLFGLTLGLSGWGALKLYQGEIEAQAAARSRALLGADLSVSARRRLTEAETGAIRAELDAVATPPGGGATGDVRWRKAERVELYSMAVAPGSDATPRLVELSFQDPELPFHGELRVRDAAGTERAVAPLPAGAWADADALIQLGASPGDTLRVADRPVRVDGAVLEDPGGAGRFSLAPRIRLPMAELARLGLELPGATLTHRWLIVIPRLPEDALAGLRARLAARISDPGVRVATHREASEQAGRALRLLGDYLGLLALVGLALAAIGCAYLFRGWLARQSADFAVLRALGASPAEARRPFLWLAALTGLAAGLLAGAIAVLAYPPLGRVLAQVAATGESGAIASALAPALPGPGSILRLALSLGGLGAGVAALAAWPGLARLSAVPVAALFAEFSRQGEAVDPSASGGGDDRRGHARGLVAFLRARGFAALTLALAWGACVVEARSWKIGSAFFGGGALTGFALLGLANAGLAWAGRRSGETRALGLAHAMREAARARRGIAAWALALGAAACLIALLPSLQRSIEGELDVGEAASDARPALFLFDLQDDQAARLGAWLAERGARLGESAPLVRARLATINGREVERTGDGAGAPGRVATTPSTRESEQEERTRNRSYNLTFRAHLTAAEEVIAGRFHDGDVAPGAGALPRISIETWFADQLALKLGDELGFEVQGVPVRGRVTSVRRVKWARFEPGFFVVFEPGALDGAPKVHLASVRVAGGAGAVAGARLQRELAREFPNVSIVDVGSVVTRIRGIIARMAGALRGMAGFAALAAFGVILAVSSWEMARRRYELALLKTLGASPGRLRRWLALETAIVATASALAGALGAQVLGWGVCRWGFEVPFAPSAAGAAAAILATPLVAVIAGLVAARGSLAVPPRAILAQE